MTPEERLRRNLLERDLEAWERSVEAIREEIADRERKIAFAAEEIAKCRAALAEGEPR